MLLEVVKHAIIGDEQARQRDSVRLGWSSHSQHTIRVRSSVSHDYLAVLEEDFYFCKRSSTTV